MIVVRKFFILIIAFFIQTTCTAAPLEISLSKGVTFGYNMGANDPEDPFFLGPPVFLSVSNPAIIQSATFWIDMGPIRVESIELVQANEFDIDFVQEETFLKLSIYRAEPRTIEGNQLIQINHDRFTHGELGFHFGEFEFINAEVVTNDSQSPDIQLSNGSWSVQTDVHDSFKLQLVDQFSKEPLENFVVKVAGYSDIPNLFEEPIQTDLPTNHEGNTFVGFLPDPSGIWFGCNNQIKSLDFWVQIIPPEYSSFSEQLVKITQQLEPWCMGDDFEDVILELTPQSCVKQFELY